MVSMPRPTWKFRIPTGTLCQFPTRDLSNGQIRRDDASGWIPKSGPPTEEVVLRKKRARSRTRSDRRDLSRERGRRHHRGGRSLRSDGSGCAFVPWSDAAKRGDVRTARLHLRLSLVRAELVRQFSVPGGGIGRRGSPPRDRADPWPCRDAPAPRGNRREGAVLRPGKAVRGACDPKALSELPIDRSPIALHARSGGAEIATG